MEGGRSPPSTAHPPDGAHGSPVAGFGLFKDSNQPQGETRSTKEKLIKARVGMLALAEELKNISLACKRAGISRSHFYEIKEAFEKCGPEGLAPATRRRRRRPS